MVHSQSLTQLIEVRRQIAIALSLAFWFVFVTAAAAQNHNYVELQVVANPSDLVSNGQKWLQVLSEVGADNVRMTQSRDGDRPGVEKTKTASGSRYKITGVINSRNQLSLPGGRYSMRETSRIKAYIDSIRADGAEVALAEKLAFGLTAEQLVSLHASLADPYGESTIGSRPSEVLSNVRSELKSVVRVDVGAAAALAGDYTLEDELKGLSHGTVLAAALRPLGLVMAPKREAGKPIELVITDSRSVEEHWPIGWPLEKRPSEAAPSLYERIPVNIQNYTLKATLGAIQSSVDVPFLYDHNSLAWSGTDLEQIRVNLESEKLAYYLVLRRVVAQAQPKLRLEIRVDESGKPFLWFWSP